jgi:hypothetical protein
MVDDQEQKIESCCGETETNEAILTELSDCSTDQPESSEEGD